MECEWPTGSGILTLTVLTLWQLSFKEGEGGYRTVGWLKASAIFLKIIFALGVLS